jgi:hypothetical protein
MESPDSKNRGDRDTHSGVRVSRPACRELSGLLPTRRWSPRSRAVCSGQSRSLETTVALGSGSLTWGGGGGRTCMACKGSSVRIDPAVPGWPIRRPPLYLEAGVAYMVVVGEDGACRCPFGVRRQQRVGRLSGTTALPPSHDKTHQLTNPHEHLFPGLAGCGGFSVSLRVWRSKATCGSRQENAPGRGSDRGRLDKSGHRTLIETAGRHA